MVLALTSILYCRFDGDSNSSEQRTYSPKDIRLICLEPDCLGQEFRSFSGLTRHINEQHSVDAVKHECAVCKRLFTRSETMLKHIQEGPCSAISTRDSLTL